MVRFGEPTFWIIFFQLITVGTYLLVLGFGIYISILLIKYLKRGIRVYDYQLKDYENKENTDEH